MVQTCYICKWRADKEPRRSFHKFPFDENEKQKWLDIIGKSNVSLGKRTSICSIHFEKSCFRYGLVNGRELLRAGSLPTLQLTRPPEPDILAGYDFTSHSFEVKIESEENYTNNWEVPVETKPDATNNNSFPVSDIVNMNSTDDKSQTKIIQETELPNIVYNNTTKSVKVRKPNIKRNKVESVKVLRIQENFKRKDVKQSTVRKLVERLRRDHIKLKNYIQTLEERQKTVGARQKGFKEKNKELN